MRDVKRAGLCDSDDDKALVVFPRSHSRGARAYVVDADDLSGISGSTCKSVVPYYYFDLIDCLKMSSSIGLPSRMADLCSEMEEDLGRRRLDCEDGERMHRVLEQLALLFKTVEIEDTTVSQGKSSLGTLPSPLCDYVVVDIETTGLDVDHDQICELGALRVVTGEVVDEFQSLVAIEGPMPRNAQRVNHITDEALAGAPSIGEAMGAFSDFLGSEEIVIVGHNARAFDIPFLKRVARQNGVRLPSMVVVDTLELARLAWPDCTRHGMGFLRSMLGISTDGAHRALADCHDELEVLRKELYVFSCKPELLGNLRPPKRVGRNPWPTRVKEMAIKNFRAGGMTAREALARAGVLAEPATLYVWMRAERKRQ